MSALRIDVGGLELAVDAGGSGAPLLLLHGFTGCAGSMAGVAADLAGSFRTLAVDLVGHGASSAPRARERYAMNDCVEQVRTLLDRLELERAHLLGYSMGGRVALAFAVSHPERVERMLLVGASAGLADPDERAKRIAADEALADRIEREGIEAFVDHWMALPLFASQKRLGEEALARHAREQRLSQRASTRSPTASAAWAAARRRHVHDHLARHPSRDRCAWSWATRTRSSTASRATSHRAAGRTRAIERIPASGHAAPPREPELRSPRAAIRFFAGEGRIPMSSTSTDTDLEGDTGASALE